MSDQTYPSGEKPLVWLAGEIRTPPFSPLARLHAGVLLRRLQGGERLAMPHSRPMPRIGSRCHELRIPDGRLSWRVIHRLDPDAIIIGDVFSKKTPQTPLAVITVCQQRFRAYDRLSAEGEPR